jgi:hypothetical protein
MRFDEGGSFEDEYADAYHRISYVSATGVYRIYLEQPLCLMEDVDKITSESVTLSG